MDLTKLTKPERRYMNETLCHHLYNMPEQDLRIAMANDKDDFKSFIHEVTLFCFDRVAQQFPQVKQKQALLEDGKIKVEIQRALGEIVRVSQTLSQSITSLPGFQSKMQLIEQLYQQMKGKCKVDAPQAIHPPQQSEVHHAVCQMAGKGPKHESKDGHHARENFHPKDSSRRGASPVPRPSGSGSVHPLDSDGPRSMAGPPMGGQPPTMILEQKLAAQQAEIQRLLGENQLLAVTYVTLRQEFAAAQQELMRMHQNRPFGDSEKEQRFTVTQVALRQELADAKQEVARLQEGMAGIQADKDQHSREKVAQMEAELKTMEALKADFEKIRFEREELVARMERMTIDVKKLPIKDQEIANLKSEVDELRQRHQQARMDFELQKKLNLERLEQTQTMEKNTFTLTREVERLRAELMSMERRLHGAYPAPNGPPLHSSALTAGAYESNYGSQEEAGKTGQQNIEPSKNKSLAEATKYNAGVEAGVQDRMPINTDPEGAWVQHTASNGKLFYYNAITGATQWNKPSSITSGDPNASYQRPLPQAALNPAVESASITGAHQQPPLAMQQPPPSQQSISPTMQQGGQFQTQQANYGVNLLVLGLSEGITDRDLASIFHPYGTVIYAKVMMDNKSGPAECYGIVTMESAQAADAAVTAVNGMFILGRHIRVEVQGKGQWPPQQQGYMQPSMQPSMMQGGAGPVRWQHQAAPPPAAGGGRWPY